MRVLLTLTLSLFLCPVQAFSISQTQGEGGQIDIRVYPNPSSSGNFTLDIGPLSAGEQIRVKVYNLIGKEVFSRQISSRAGRYIETIHLGNYARGMYMLEVIRGDDKQTRRLSFI